MPHGLLLLLSIFAFLGLSSQRPLNWSADDGKRVAELEANGVRMDGTHVMTWLPAGIMGEAERKALLDRLDRGVRELRGLVGVHDWQFVRDQRITYYISSDEFVAHATGRAAIFVPLARLKDGRAPFFHEAGHELLAPLPISETTPEQRARFSLWLSEGLADYVGQTAAERAATVDGDVFSVGGLKGVDRTCATRLDSPGAHDIVGFIGEARGGPPALFTTDRQKVAPTFYACAFSFTKFVVDRIGLKETIAMMPHVFDDGLPARLESLAGKPVSALRSEWLAAIRERR